MTDRKSLSKNSAPRDSLRSTTPIMNELKLTKVPVNNRINELEKYGLLKRQKGNGKAEATDLTILFVELISKVKENVKINLPDLLPGIVK